MAKSLKKKLKDGYVTLGGWAMIGHPASVEIMARSGFDWVAIDLEHSATDMARAEDMIRAADCGGAPALVRLTSNNADQIKRVMDAGATGIIVPMVETPEDAAAAVAALYYPPKGKRGVGLARNTKYGAPDGFKDYQKWLDKEAVCIVQIEHIDAVKNAEAILSVDGVDGYMLGPYDLSASMGLAGDLDHPDVLAAMDKVREIAGRLGKPGGLHVVEPDEKRLKEAAESGFTFIAYSIDTRIIDTVCRAGVKAVKG